MKQSLKDKLIGLFFAVLMIPAIGFAGYGGIPKNWKFNDLEAVNLTVTGESSFASTTSDVVKTDRIESKTTPIIMLPTGAGGLNVQSKLHIDSGATGTEQTWAFYGGESFGIVDSSTTDNHVTFATTDNGQSLIFSTKAGGELLFQYGGTGYKIWSGFNDGAGSGLDADKIDGRQVDAGTIWTSGNDGNGSGLDADTLDGRTTEIIWGSGNDGTGTGLDADVIDGVAIVGADIWTKTNDGAASGLDADVIDGVAIVGADIWTATNDGAASGLDADLIDGRSVATGTIWTSDNDGTLSGLDADKINGRSIASGTIWTSDNDGGASGLDADLIDGRQVATGTIWTSDNDGDGSALDAGLVKGKAILRAAYTIDFPNTSADSFNSSAQTLTSAVAGSTCAVSSDSASFSGMIYRCKVHTTNNVTVYAWNARTTAYDPASASYAVTVFNK